MFKLKKWIISFSKRIILFSFPDLVRSGSRLSLLTTPVTNSGTRRGILRTPKSIASGISAASSANRNTSFFTEASSGHFVAVVEGRGNARGEVGMASISLTNPTLVLCQFSDTRTYSRTMAKLTLFNPSDVWVTGLFAHTWQTHFYLSLCQLFSCILRKHFMPTNR